MSVNHKAKQIFDELQRSYPNDPKRAAAEGLLIIESLQELLSETLEGTNTDLPSIAMELNLE